MQGVAAHGVIIRFRLVASEVAARRVARERESPYNGPLRVSFRMIRAPECEIYRPPPPAEEAIFKGVILSGKE